MMRKAKTVEAYIKAAPASVQGKLKELRMIIRKTVPLAEERISYCMPYYHYKGRLAYFAVFKKHMSLFIPTPVIEEHQRNLKNYETTKATVHFSFDKPLPVALIKKLVAARMKMNEAQYVEKAVKTCNRGHKYKGKSPCPKCWPGSIKKTNKR